MQKKAKIQTTHRSSVRRPTVAKKSSRLGKPQLVTEFYKESIKRPDVHAIMEKLSKL